LYSFIANLIFREVQPSECLCEIIKMNLIKMKKIFILLYYFVMHYSDIVFLELQFDCWRGRDEWVSMWNNLTKMRRIFILLCYFVMHYSDIVFLYLQFDCRRGRVDWVSVWNNKNEFCELVYFSLCIEENIVYSLIEILLKKIQKFIFQT